MFVCVWAVPSHFSHAWLVTPWTVGLQASLSLGFSQQEYWSGLPCPPPGDRHNPGIKTACLASPALQADSLPAGHWGSPGILVVLFNFLAEKIIFVLK